MVGIHDLLKEGMNYSLSSLDLVGECLVGQSTELEDSS